MTTKADIINVALSEIGIDPNQYGLSVEDLQQIGFRLDSYVLELQTMGIHFPYNFGSGGLSIDISVESLIPQSYISMVYMNLAVRCCSSFGKIPPASLLKSAKDAFDAAIRQSVKPVKSSAVSGAFMGAGSGYNGSIESEYQQASGDDLVNDNNETLDYK